MRLLAISLLLLIPLASCQEPAAAAAPPSLLEGFVGGDQLPPLPTLAPLPEGLDQNGLGPLPPFPGFAPPPPLPPPNFNSPMSKRVMSSMTDLPSVIKSQMEGNPKPLRNMISHMLGEGLLSKLITSPIQAAEEMGMPLEDLGFNKTEAFRKLKTDLQSQNITAPLDFDSFFGSDSKPSTPPSSPEETTTPQMFIEGKPVADFDQFITNYNPKDPNGKPYFKKGKKKPTRVTPDPEQLAVEDAIMRSRMQASGMVSPHQQQQLQQLQQLQQQQQYFDPTLAGTMPIGSDPLPQPVSADIANTLDTNLIDPRRMNEVNNLLRRAPMQNPSASAYSQQAAVAPVPIGIGSPDTLTPVDSSLRAAQMAAALDPLNVPAVAFDSQIQSVVDTLKTKSVNSLSVNEVKELQAVLQNFEQTIKTKDLLNKKRELQALQEQLEQQQRAEMEMRMKEQHLMEARQQIESQLQAELSSFQSGFGLRGERLPTHPAPRATPAPFDETLLERALAEQTMIGPERGPLLMTTTRRPTMPTTTTRRAWTTRRPTTTTTEAPAQEEMIEELTEKPSGGLKLGGLSMGMSVVKRRPLPASRQVASEEGSDEPQPRVIPPARVRENPFNMVRYGPEEQRREEETKRDEEEEEDEDRVLAAPTAGGGRRMGAPVTKKRPQPVTPSPPRSASWSMITPAPRSKDHSVESAPPRDSTEDLNKCECVEISQERMVGSWVPALASPSVIARIEEAAGVLLDEDSATPTCAKFEFSVPRMQRGAKSAKMAISFKTEQKSGKITKLRGTAVSADSRSLEVKLNDLHGNDIIAPFCVLKAEGATVYEYMVVVTTPGPCNEAVLFVRDPDAFFDGNNAELIGYFKHKISRKELEPLQAVPFSNDCSSR